MLYFILKSLHVLGALLFLGVGLGSAWYKLRASTSGDPKVVAWASREIVLADWLFTVPSALIMPITGLWLASLMKMPWTRGFVAVGVAGFVVAGGLWLPAVWLQLRMKRLANDAAVAGELPGPEYRRLMRIWMVLGVPAFVISVGLIWVMVAKWSPAFLR